MVAGKSTEKYVRTERVREDTNEERRIENFHLHILQPWCTGIMSIAIKVTDLHHLSNARRCSFSKSGVPNPDATSQPLVAGNPGVPQPGVEPLIISLKPWYPII